ncbi:hypothetical protein PYJP_05560 [Pyrofollis japonicus]|uniref:cytochrome c biogenesis protein CcsA n=1 Tax=Pyrofollis japonicus TaxID=3060460 RepID=UPI00295BAE17|nr:cytochrome c biogenesis protein CcsA [Pyrofollis japonicus]BEP17204.1 hypothetical protein PYJP_05560 [Pyrofollis japonicus]
MSFHIGPLHYTGILPLIAVLVLLYAIYESIVRGRDAAKYLRIGFLLVAIGWLIYWIPFVTLDFTLHEVFWNTSPGLPTWMRFAAAWAGGGGSLFLFALIASLGGLYLLRSETSRWLQAALASITVIGLAAAFLNDAFTVLPQKPVSGAGLNPLLKSPWLYPHPLSTFSGYALLAVASAALLAGMRRKGYILFEIGWALLTLGILLGGYWSYETFGWGGYWAWDPVETSELMVWLAATILPHLLVVAPSLAPASEALLASSVFLAMYVTRTGLSPLHSFAAPSLGALILLATAYAWLVLAGLALYKKVEDGWRELVRSVRSLEIYRVGLLVAAISLIIASLFVYSTLLVPASMTVAGKSASVPQMSAGIKFFHPVLYPLLIVMLAAIPAAFLGQWLGWRGYFALLVTVGATAAVLGAAGYTDKIDIAPLSPDATNAMMLFGLPWAGTAAAATITYIVIRAKKGLLILLRDRFSGLSLLHLGLAITVIGVLLSGTYAFNESYMKEYHIKPGDTIVLPGGFKLSFEGFSFGISDSKVDIYTRYVNHTASYYYGQVALFTLAQDFARLIQEYENGKKMYETNTTAKTLLKLALRGTIPAPGTFVARGRATVKYINFATNTTLVIAQNEPVEIELTNITLRPMLNQDNGSFYLFMPIQAAELKAVFERNVSNFLPAVLGVHDLLAFSFTEPLRISIGNITLIISNATILSEQLLTGGKGEPLHTYNNTIGGKMAILDTQSGTLEVNGTKIASIPAEIPSGVITYYIAESTPSYKKVIDAIKETGLYDLLKEPENVLKLAFSPDCLKTIHSGASFAANGCEAYVKAPKLVPETAWLDVVFKISRGGSEKLVKERIRFEAYGEIQGIHGLVPKVIHPGEGIDEVYIVLEPPMINSFLYGSQIAYHELLIYYLHEAFKNLTPPERLALAAVMIGGYQSDLLGNLGNPQQAQSMLEGSLVDVYLLASKYDPRNSTILRDGLTVKVKIVPGARLVWLGPVLMAISALYLAGMALALRRGGR